jgi:hypothetical protein
MSLPGEREIRGFALSEGPAELMRHWRSRHYENRGGWLNWIRRDGSSRAPALAYKLYVSPPPTWVREVLREAIP